MKRPDCVSSNLLSGSTPQQKKSSQLNCRRLVNNISVRKSFLCLFPFFSKLGSNSRLRNEMIGPSHGASLTIFIYLCLMTDNRFRFQNNFLGQGNQNCTFFRNRSGGELVDSMGQHCSMQTFCQWKDLFRHHSRRA